MREGRGGGERTLSPNMLQISLTRDHYTVTHTGDCVRVANDSVYQKGEGQSPVCVTV